MEVSSECCWWMLAVKCVGGGLLMESCGEGCWWLATVRAGGVGMQ